ncbi:efflux RND transporter periplasmic adaptor subunit [Maribacter chungangensis]|uniref:Efflux RND transporter periplasmic adaptor subunit n=1 Tax=Maribacter chungangensis TaxID=1069117 RepID=A0ABW3B5V2_9FLAO
MRRIKTDIVSLAGIVFVFFLMVACKSDQEKVLPQKTTITQSVYASATVQPDSLYEVYAVVSGILEANTVAEGNTVQKGDVIAQITNTAPELNTENAKLSLELAKENYSGSSGVLRGIEEEIAAAALRYRNDSVNYHRQKRLWEQNIGSKMEYDNRKLAFELSHNNLVRLQHEYERTKNQLRTQLQQARNNYSSARVGTTDFSITSKINGTVYALYKNPGEIVSIMEPLAAIGSSDVFVVDLLVDEVDIVNVKTGQKVLLVLDAYSATVFEASVHKIYPKKDERSQTFTVEALFNAPPAVLYPGLSGEANIVVAQQTDALVIPRDYLLEGNKVRTETGLQTIQLGLQDLDRVQVLKGLDAQTYILKPRQ